MERMCGFRSSGDYPMIMSSESPSDYQNLFCSSTGDNRVYGSDQVQVLSAEAPKIRRADDNNISFGLIKSRIAAHPLYPRLLQTYIDCQKVGAPMELHCLLEEIQRENKREVAALSCYGVDPELDEFMETYCNILVKYKSDLARPFDEATTFLNKIELQLQNLCTGPVSTRSLSGICKLLVEVSVSVSASVCSGELPATDLLAPCLYIGVVELHIFPG